MILGGASLRVSLHPAGAGIAVGAALTGGVAAVAVGVAVAGCWCGGRSW
jgi:hypothetical protein